MSATSTAPAERAACVMNGSVRKPASMSPFFSAATVFGRGSGTHLTPAASTWWSASTDFVSVSAIVFGAEMPIRLPARSVTERMPDAGSATTPVERGPADDASATSRMSAVPLLRATKNGV